MKKISSLNFIKTIYTLFVIGNIISVIIVYKDVQSNIAIKFVIGYVILAFFCLIYFSLVTIFKFKKLKWNEIRKRLIRFVTIFILLSMSNFAFDYFFRPLRIDLFRKISIPLGLAFGMSFLDILFKSKTTNT